VGVGVVVVSGATPAPLAAVPYAAGILLCEVAFTLLAVPLLKEITPLQVSAFVCLVAVPMLAAAAVVEPGAAVQMPTVIEGSRRSTWPCSPPRSRSCSGTAESCGSAPTGPACSPA
jgi:hypothetical protein